MDFLIDNMNEVLNSGPVAWTWDPELQVNMLQGNARALISDLNCVRMLTMMMM